MLHYKTFVSDSSRPWVTFIHGAGGSSNIWFQQLKAFSAYFNVLLVDLRGHGGSKKVTPNLSQYTFSSVSKDVMEVLDHLKIEKTHFVGISLGTIIIRELAEQYPDRVQSMVLGGAILKFNFQGQLLMKIGDWTKRFIPYILLYRIFAFVIMPKRNHSASRNLFINEAKKLAQKEFLRWYKLTSSVNQVLKWYRSKDINIPTLYLMGNEDHMFLEPVKEIIKIHKSATLHIIEPCGHVVNVDQPAIFNQVAIRFIQSIKS